MKPSTPSSLRPYLWFQRAARRFAVPMDFLQEVLPLQTLRPLPATEPALAGLITLRQHVLPVFDPLSLVGGNGSSSSAGIVIVLGWQNRPGLGLLAETVGKVVGFAEPQPLKTAMRLESAFAGEVTDANQSRLLAVNVMGLATKMGLIAL